MKQGMSRKDALEQNGLPGVARVWRSALGEVFSAAVPLQLQSSIVVATSLALLSSVTGYGENQWSFPLPPSGLRDS
jgi:hypothetical protein